MSEQESRVRIDLHPIACVSAGNIFLSQKEAAAGAAREGGVAGRQEGEELPGAGVEAGEVLEVTVDEEALEATVGEEALEALVVVFFIFSWLIRSSRGSFLGFEEVLEKISNFLRSFSSLCS